MNKIKVGDTLFVVENYGRPYGREEKERVVVVTKVGTQYLYTERTDKESARYHFKGPTFSKETLIEKDGHGSPAHAWLTEADYRLHAEAKGAWAELWTMIYRHSCNEPPRGVSAADIALAMKTLKLESK